MYFKTNSHYTSFVGYLTKFGFIKRLHEKLYVEKPLNGKQIKCYDRKSLFTHQMRGALQPIAIMGQDVVETFQPYLKSKYGYHIFKDFFQPFRGIANTLRGLSNIVIGIVLFIVCTILLIGSLCIGKFDFAKEMGRMLVYSFSWFMEGIANVIRGITQIAATPLTWLIKIPLRGVITAIKGFIAAGEFIHKRYHPNSPAFYGLHGELEDNVLAMYDRIENAYATFEKITSEHGLIQAASGLDVEELQRKKSEIKTEGKALQDSFGNKAPVEACFKFTGKTSSTNISSFFDYFTQKKDVDLPQLQAAGSTGTGDSEEKTDSRVRSNSLLSKEETKEDELNLSDLTEIDKKIKEAVNAFGDSEEKTDSRVRSNSLLSKEETKEDELNLSDLTEIDKKIKEAVNAFKDKFIKTSTMEALDVTLTLWQWDVDDESQKAMLDIKQVAPNLKDSESFFNSLYDISSEEAFFQVLHCNGNSKEEIAKKNFAEGYVNEFITQEIDLIFKNLNKDPGEKIREKYCEKLRNELEKKHPQEISSQHPPQTLNTKGL